MCLEIDLLESVTPQIFSFFTKLNLFLTFVIYIEGTFKCAKLEPSLGKLERVEGIKGGMYTIFAIYSSEFLDVHSSY